MGGEFFSKKHTNVFSNFGLGAELLIFAVFSLIFDAESKYLVNWIE